MWVVVFLVEFVDICRTCFVISLTMIGVDDTGFVLAIDADELMSDSLLKSFHEKLEELRDYDIKFYWFNVVGSLYKIRQDAAYKDNFRTFICPTKGAGKFNLEMAKYHHHSRLPESELQAIEKRDLGFIHLQALNIRFYVLKQLWYKHFEYVTWNHSVDFLNARYDPVVNDLNFEEIETPISVTGEMEFDPSVFDEIEKEKGYEQFVLDHYQEDLVTFGKDYLSR